MMFMKIGCRKKLDILQNIRFIYYICKTFAIGK